MSEIQLDMKNVGFGSTFDEDLTPQVKNDVNNKTSLLDKLKEKEGRPLLNCISNAYGPG